MRESGLREPDGCIALAEGIDGAEQSLTATINAGFDAVERRLTQIEDDYRELNTQVRSEHERRITEL